MVRTSVDFRKSRFAAVGSQVQAMVWVLPPVEAMSALKVRWFSAAVSAAASTPAGSEPPFSWMVGAPVAACMLAPMSASPLSLHDALPILSCADELPTDSVAEVVADVLLVE